MKITVVVKANAKENKLERQSNEMFKAFVKAQAQEDKANEAVKKLLAEYFNIPKSLITLKIGRKTKNKVFIISG